MKQGLKDLAKKVPGARRAYQLIKPILKKSIQGTTLRKNPAPNINKIKDKFIRESKTALKSFLESDSRITFELCSNYEVSVVIPVYNKAEFTFRCLKNLSKQRGVKLEVIIINNASTDQTSKLLSKVDNIKIISNANNLHFLKASNQGAQQARAEHVLFLNNDAEPEDGAIKKALDIFKSRDQIGALGAKLILPDGNIQEAGCIVWRDGTCCGYGRGWEKEHSVSQFERVVDYCSGAFLLLSKRILEQLNYFDDDFSPAYYEETDLCLRLQKLGLKVIYSPEVVVNHFEFASGGMSGAIELMTKNRFKLLNKHGDLLKSKFDKLTPHLHARSLSKRKKILYIDELLPLEKLGAGYPRAVKLVNIMHSMGFDITVVPLLQGERKIIWNEIYNEYSREIEFIGAEYPGTGGLLQLLCERVNYYDFVWISRPSTMAEIRKISPDLTIFAGSKVIYDAEAIFTLRDIAYANITNNPLTEQQIKDKFDYEFSLCAGVNAISSVSPKEAHLFKERFDGQVEVISSTHKLSQEVPNFSDRDGLVFLGAFHGDHGPNPDSIIWFVEEVLPRLVERGFTSKLSVIGTNKSPRIQGIKHPQIEIIGAVDDLSYWINKSRVFIAPTRFAAGIPLKVTEVSSYGLPAVVSELLAQQLCWQDGKEFLVGKTADEFAEKIVKLHSDQELWQTVSTSCRARIANDFSEANCANTLERLLV